MLKQIVYVSFATRLLKLDIDANIEHILETARAHNAKQGITGQLIYRGGMFVQLLEGEQRLLEPLLGRILLDRSRHENLKVVLDQPLTQRIFPDWSMAYKKLDNAALDLVNTITPWQNLMNLSGEDLAASPERILSIFEKLRD